MRFHLRYLDTLQDKSSAGVPIHLDAGCSKDEVGLIFNGMQDARRLLAGLYDWTQGKLKGPEYDVIIEKYLGTDKEVIKGRGWILESGE